jgi:hypothetical protein
MGVLSRRGPTANGHRNAGDGPERQRAATLTPAAAQSGKRAATLTPAAAQSGKRAAHRNAGGGPERERGVHPSAGGPERQRGVTLTPRPVRSGSVESL